jgi:hypothetical protein
MAWDGFKLGRLNATVKEENSRPSAGKPFKPSESSVGVIIV